MALSGASFWSLLAGVLALAVAAQYAVIVVGGARGAAHYAHDAWLSARSSAQHYAHDVRDTASSVMHGAPHWAWASADTSHPAEALRRARTGFLRARAWPWNWLRADTRYYDAPHGAGDTLFTRLFYHRRPACAPPLKCACPLDACSILRHLRRCRARRWQLGERGGVARALRSVRNRHVDARAAHAVDHALGRRRAEAARRGRRAQRTCDAATARHPAAMTKTTTTTKT